MAEIFQNQEQIIEYVGIYIAEHRKRFSCIAASQRVAGPIDSGCTSHYLMPTQLGVCNHHSLKKLSLTYDYDVSLQLLQVYVVCCNVLRWYVAIREYSKTVKMGVKILFSEVVGSGKLFFETPIDRRFSGNLTLICYYYIPYFTHKLRINGNLSS